MASVSQDSVTVDHMIAANSSLSPSPFVSINLDMVDRNVIIVNDNIDDTEEAEPARKRIMSSAPSSPSLSGNNNNNNNSSSDSSKTLEGAKLATRLEELLCCAVCLDLPKIAMYQCNQGHLMCAACFAHLLADGRLRDITLTCPNCRVETNKSTVTRNRAVEKIAFELPSQCQYCKSEFAYKFLMNHEKNVCPMRIVKCKYAPIGCEWQGAFVNSLMHEKTCAFPKKTGAELLPIVNRFQEINDAQQKTNTLFLEACNNEKITFIDVKMKSVRLYSNSNVLSYESQPFPAFDHKWGMRARINNNQREPHQSEERSISYQLVLFCDQPVNLNVNYCVLKGPFNNINIQPQLYKHNFVPGCLESEYRVLPLPDSTECNRLIAEEAFYVRMLMATNYAG